MNIFLTSNCPIACAEALDDRRVIKMALETAQILSTVAHKQGIKDERFYKPTHANHPCVVWAGASWTNFTWTVAHAIALCSEYWHRFGADKNKQHAALQVIEALQCHSLYFETFEQTKPANCSFYPEEQCVLEAYQATLREKWKADGAAARWTKREKPIWARGN